MAGTKLFLLGTPRIECEGETIHLQRRKALALLAYLAVTNQAHSRDVLSTFLWPEHDQKAALAGLRRALSNLRRYIGDECFEIERDSISILCAQHLWVDIHEFREQIQQWQSHDHPQNACSECMASLAKAVKLYRDNFMSGFNLPDCPDFDDWQNYERQRLHSDLAIVLKWLSEANASTEKYKQATEYAHRWLLLDNMEEAAHRQLMRLYALAGQRAAALRQYDECTSVLDEELGVEPSEETKELHKSILENRLQPSVKEKVHAPEPIREKPRHNLPVQLTPFIGREKELKDIAHLLDDPNVRLLTVLGSGGVGKTRLALEAANGQLDKYKNGVFFVSLAPLESVHSIVPAIADGVGFSFYEGVEPRQQILNYMERKNMLLVMDNYEHLLDGVDVVADILRTAPEVKILTTSRSRLNLGGEQRYPLAGMDFPSPISHDVDPLDQAMGFSSVRLFVNCAQRAQPDFELDADALPHAVRICRLLGGIPLAIRLAAAWVELLSIDKIADEIQKSIDFLDTDRQDVPERQRSMRAVFDHSWNLLSEAERRVLAGLSVFRGGFMLEAAQAVTGASLRTLMVLVDRALMQRESGERYTIHELLRQYAGERLKENLVDFKEVKDNHSAYYCKKLERWEPELKSSRQVETLKEMDLEIENCRAAWEWSAEQKAVESIHKGIESLYLFHLWRYRIREADEIFNYAIQQLADKKSPDEIIVLLKIYSRQADHCFYSNQSRKLEQLYINIKQLLDNHYMSEVDIQLEKAISLLHSSVLSWFSGYYQQAMDIGKESLRMLRLENDPWWTATTLNRLGSGGYLLGQYNDSIQWREESLSLFRTVGDPRGIVSCLDGLGCTYADEGQLEKGEKLLREAVEITRKIDDQVSLAGVLKDLAVTITGSKGAFKEAQSLLNESVQLGIDIGNAWVLPLSVVCLGYTKLFLGDYEGAYIEFQEGLKLAHDFNEPRSIAFAMLYLAKVALVREKYDIADQLLKEINTTNIDVMPPIERSLAFSAMGILCCKLGALFDAKNYLVKAIQSASRIGTYQIHLIVSPAIAMLIMMEGRIDKAVELYSFLESHFPKIAKSRFEADVIGKSIKKSILFSAS